MQDVFNVRDLGITHMYLPHLRDHQIMIIMASRTSNYLHVAGRSMYASYSTFVSDNSGNKICYAERPLISSPRGYIGPHRKVKEYILILPRDFMSSAEVQRGEFW
jgi:hypothetical protein